MRAAAFQEVGGFQAKLLAGEEPELCARLRARGWSVQRIDAEMTLHDADMTRFRQWWLRGIRSGYGYAQVWNATRRSQFRLYGRELARAIAWSVAVPLAAVAAALAHVPSGPFVLLLYPLQIVRLAFARGASEPLSWWYGSLIVLSKFAEAFGAARFYTVGRRKRVVIDYKR
jgi:hypothetical protein